MQNLILPVNFSKPTKSCTHFFGTEALFERDFPIFENSDTGKRAKRREKWKNRARDDI